MALDPGDYTAAMRMFPAAVNIVTTGSGENRSGLTATAVMSLTADPPQLGVAVNRSSSAHPHLVRNGAFCVNTLAAEHNEVAWRFAGKAKGSERFAGLSWTTLATGAPVLEDAIVNLDCRIATTLELSTHTLFVGEVEAVRRNRQGRPLLFVDGTWASLLPSASVDMDRFIGGVEQSIVALESALAREESCEAQLHAIVRDLTTIFVERREISQDYRLAEIYVAPENLARLNAAKRDFDRRLATVLQDGARRGEFDVDDASLTAFAIEGMVAWVHRWFRPGGRLKAEEVGQRLGELANRMVRRKD